jgi:hypothetical protein
MPTSAHLLRQKPASYSKSSISIDDPHLGRSRQIVNLDCQKLFSAKSLILHGLMKPVFMIDASQ